MKTNNKKHRKPFHLHVEHMLRNRVIICLILTLLTVAIFKTDGKLLGTLREAYAQGAGALGVYMREETVRMPVSFNTAARIPTISSR